MKTRILFPILIIFALTACAAATPAPPLSTVEVEYVPVEKAAAEPAPVVSSGNTQLAAHLPAAGRMVIKDAELDLLVADISRAMDQVTQLAADQGGYLIKSEARRSGEYMRASIKLAVPATAFERTLAALRQLGIQVLRETSGGQDVSAEYTDLKFRLANLEATAAWVREFLKDAKTVEESLKVNAYPHPNPRMDARGHV